ncbi:MAG: thioredoxin-dependent thiol peroxidase [Robiginitomaculum sp.]|nr:thioredoxin-dependent thiol peroxidase [Robiginitomaculum sp.]
MTKPLTVADIAPDFILPGDGAQDISLSDFAGQTLVLYFYPKDDTPGCTKQAIAFSESLSSFTQANTIVVGVSKDSVKKHDKFKAKHQLKIRLAADEELNMLQSYGVWIEKSMYGRKYMGIERSTFLIDGTGKIAQIWRKVKIPGHVDTVLAAAQELAG